MKFKIGFLGLLCLFFRVAAQDKIQVDKGLKVGDRVPVAVLGEGVKGRLMLLDFWATWCAPCRAMVPRLDSLQRVFGDQLLVLPVAYEPEAVVRPVLAAMRRERAFRFEREIFGDTVLVKLFPHRVLPHYVWIGGDGLVLAVTEGKEVTAANVRRLLVGEIGLEEKRDVRIPFDGSRALFFSGNGGNGAEVVYHSVLSGYVPGLPGGNTVSMFDPIKGQRFSSRNSPLLWLYRLAFRNEQWFTNAQVRILSKDSLKMTSKLTGKAYVNWLAAGNGWCYELQVPPALAAQAFEMIRSDLQRLFPAYTARIESQMVKCLALVRTSTKDRIKSAGGKREVIINPFSCRINNAPLNELLERLRMQYLQNSVLPVVDATGYKGPVDLELNAGLTNLTEINKALAAYDLQFVEQEAPVRLLVIRDSFK